MSNKPKAIPRQSRPPTSTGHNLPLPNYKFDTTKTILDGLILTPNFGTGFQNSSALEENQGSSNELEFQPPVPHSTANLLSMAEEKVKAMSNSSNIPSRRGGVMSRQSRPGTSGLGVAQLSRSRRPLAAKAATGKLYVNKDKSLPLNDNNTTSSTQALKWLRGEQADVKSKKRLGRTRHSKPIPSPSNKLKDVFAPEEPDKLITIGGYIINIEKGLPPQMSTSVRPMVSSNERGVEIEVRIKDVNPAKIVVEKRYNSILVIGVKESGLKTPRAPLPASETSLPYGFEDDVIEVVNIFAPRDISLARVLVTPADSKGRLFIKAP